MNINRFGLFDLRLFNLDGGGGMGGGGSDPGPGPGGGGGNPTPSTEPTVYEVDENTLIKPKGMDKAVKYGEHVKGFQTQYTKAAQERARIEKELNTARETSTRYERELQTLRQQSQRGGQGQPDVFDALRQLPYLTGEHAVEVVQSIGQEINRRDQVILAALKEIQSMKQIVGGLHQSSNQNHFEAKINKFVDDAGIGKEYLEFAKTLYVAHEGDDLDQEFPRILMENVEALRKTFAGERERKVQAARQVPFIPGKGAHTGPTKPLEIKPNATSKEVAELLFPTLGGIET